MIYKNAQQLVNSECHPYLNDPKNNLSFESLCKYVNIFSETDNIQMSKIFAINILRFDEFARNLDTKKFLNYKIISHINSGKALLVLNHFHERTHKYVQDYHRLLWDMLYEKLESLRIQKDRIVFISGDANIENTFKKNNDKSKVIGLDSMEYVFSVWSKSSKIVEMETSKFSLDKKFDYMFLNSVPRPQRCVLKYFLHKKRLIKKSLNSWVIGDKKPCLVDIANFCKYNNIDADPKKVFNISSKETILDTPYEFLRTGPHNQNKIPEDFLKKTIFSLVTETHLYDDVMLISEKTYKPILQKHPFMVYSHPNHMQYLKDCGYVTYSEMFDESYDFKNGQPKINTIIENLKSFKDRVSGKEHIIEEKLEHNRQHFISSPCKEKTEQKILELFE